MHTIKKLLAAALLLLAVKIYAQEMLYLNGQKFKVSDIENITFTSTRPLLPDVLATYEEYSIFSAALEATGLADSLAYWDRFKNYSCSNNTGRPGSSWGNTQFYVPTECKISYTIFAEDNTAFAGAGIYNLEDLIAKCAEWYGGASAWYDYPGKDKGVKISTGSDYTNPWNVLNMFVRYHIVKGGMSYSKLVYERDANRTHGNWNYAFGGEPYDYYETLLPHTLIKIWQPLYQNTGSATNIWINRWRRNNTLTDEVGTFGSDETHDIMQDGCLIRRMTSTDIRTNIITYNGFIHAINKPLVYDENVPYGVLNERIRVDMGAILPELSSNYIRYALPAEIGAMNPYSNSGDMTRLPLDYFDNFVSYVEKGFHMAWYATGPWRTWQSDQLSIWGVGVSNADSTYGCMDFAFRLPSVPTGTYEIRIIYPPMSNCGIVQPYIGTSKDAATMQPLTSFDARYPNSSNEEDRKASGYLLIDEFTDYGAASDVMLRSNGYMRAPASFARGTYNTVPSRISEPQALVESVSASCRYEEGYGTTMLRRILGTVHLDQQKEYWLRLKITPSVGYTALDQMGFNLDFIELVPKSVTDNPNFSEDWY